jgi:transcriptional regulator with XRE-family HTH domain
MKLYLKAWREFRGLSQEQVGNTLGVRHTTIGRWEKGAVLTTEQLQALAEAYTATVPELMAPPDNADLVRKLTRAQSIIDGMDGAALDHWFAVGEHMKGNT